MSNFNKQHPNDEFALDRALVLLFRRQCIITVKNDLIDPKGFNLQQVPGKPYRSFKAVFSAEQAQLERLFEPGDVIYLHMLAVRTEAYDVIGEEYLFIRAYRVGHTLEGETILVVVETQVKGGCYIIDEDGHIGGDGNGRWCGVLCPAEAESQLVADLKAEEAKRRELLPKCYFRRVDNNDEVDTSEIS
jgi:hypothetical protein